LNVEEEVFVVGEMVGAAVVPGGRSVRAWTRNVWGSGSLSVLLNYNRVCNGSIECRDGYVPNGSGSGGVWVSGVAVSDEPCDHLFVGRVGAGVLCSGCVGGGLGACLAFGLASGGVAAAGVVGGVVGVEAWARVVGNG